MCSVRLVVMIRSTWVIFFMKRRSGHITSVDFCHDYSTSGRNADVSRYTLTASWLRELHISRHDTNLVINQKIQK